MRAALKSGLKEAAANGHEGSAGAGAGAVAVLDNPLSFLDNKAGYGAAKS